MPKRPLLAAFVVAPLAAALAFACIPPPPKIASIPASGLSVRVFAFGAFAEAAVENFKQVKENNPSFAVVPAGGDGEVLIGIEQDTGACVEPTALCSMRVSYRVKNAQGEVVRQENEIISANADNCSMICEKALSNAIVKVIDAAAVGLKGPMAGAAPVASAAPTVEPAADAGVKDKDPKKTKVAPPPPAAKPRPEAGLCAVGTGPRLPSDEAERRVGQVEALKRLGVIDAEEFECLKKAFLARL